MTTLTTVDLPEDRMVRATALNQRLLCKNDHPDRWVSPLVATRDPADLPGAIYCPECAAAIVGLRALRALLSDRLKEL